MKGSIRIAIVYTTVLLCMICLPVAAQQVKTVSGYVMNVGEGRKAVPFRERVRVYACNTIAIAQDAIKQLNSSVDQKNIFFDDSAVADKDGYYSIRVMENGALLFRVGMKNKLIEVKSRTEINANIEGEGIELPTVTAIGISIDPGVEKGGGEVINDEQIRMFCKIPFPANFGKTNSRLIIQPYVVNCATHDTIQYPSPIIINGNEFSLTQERRTGFNISRDPLNKYTLTQTLNGEKKIIYWDDTVAVKDTKENYTGRVIILAHDYTRAFYRKDQEAAACQMRRPLKFLEYSFGVKELNPNDYKQTPRREKRNTTGNVSLTFLQGEAQPDPKDPQNEIQLSKLKEDLMEIVNGDGTTLRQVSIIGVASPEGRYAVNLALAKRRTQYAMTQIAANVPAYTRARLTTLQDTKVATWGEVADVLEKDSLLAEAAKIRAIESKFSKNMDAQYAAISKLDNYKRLIEPRLPKLRTVHYKYEYDVMRELNAQEILSKYEQDADYRNGKKSFTLYEYWHLFQTVKKPEELEALYRRAYNDSKSNGEKPWELAANNLAVSYLKRDTFDLEILKPFISKKTTALNKEADFGNGIEITNPEWAIINQLAMCIQAQKYRQADTLAAYLPYGVEEYKMPKAFARCLNGRYRTSANMNAEMLKRNRETFNLICSSSPRNEVVMLLAMDNDIYNELAQNAIERLPQDDALTYYLKAIIAKRLKNPNKYWENPEEDYLLEAFKRDKKLITVAANDGDIGEDLYDIVMDRYKTEK